jgi:hypothetical protein
LLIGERFSLAVRNALFEEGLDVSDPGVLHELCLAHGVPDATEADRSTVARDFSEGWEPRDRRTSSRPVVTSSVLHSTSNTTMIGTRCRSTQAAFSGSSPPLLVETLLSRVHTSDARCRSATAGQA